MNGEKIKVDPIFKRELDEIKQKRIANKIDNVNRPKSYMRLTMAMRRLKDWEIIKERLINAEMKNEKID